MPSPRQIVPTTARDKMLRACRISRAVDIFVILSVSRLGQPAHILPRSEPKGFFMLLFLDTEYTGFGQVPRRLISLGIVAEDASSEFYVELADTWRMEDCSDFVKREVLPLLAGKPVAFEHSRGRLREWFLSAPRAVRIACDSGTDFRFLLDLLGDPLPKNLATTYFDLRPLIDVAVYDRTVSNYYQRDDRVHHALVDARAHRKGWLAWMDARKSGRRDTGTRAGISITGKV